MTTYQSSFTPNEAMAVCEMIAKLANESYAVEIYQGFAVEDERGEGDRYYPFRVEVLDTDGDTVSSGQSYYLVDALSEAYQATPEAGVE